MKTRLLSGGVRRVNGQCLHFETNNPNVGVAVLLSYCKTKAYIPHAVRMSA